MCVTGFYIISGTKHNIWPRALTYFFIKWIQWVLDKQTPSQVGNWNTVEMQTF